MGDLIELAAAGATALAVVGVVPQLARLRRTNDTAGVSLPAAAVGCATEGGWIVYTVRAGLWSALPVAVTMVVTTSPSATRSCGPGPPSSGL